MKPPDPVLLIARELDLGGTERQLAEMARSLDRDEFEPHTGCFRPGGLRAAELEAAGVPVALFPATSFHGPAALRGARALGEYVRRHNIRLVHTFDVPANVFAAPVARMFGVPRVISSQRAHRGLTPGILRHLLRLTDQIADAVVVNCESVRRELIDEEHVPAGRIHLCYNGVDTDVFRSCPEMRPDGAPVVGIVCALRKEKDLGTLLGAFAQVRHAHRGVKLLIVGGGPERERVEALARDLALGDAFHLEPATNRVAGWLRAIDIFVLPSRSEALSNSLMEAMACGCAVVASRAGGNPELVTEGRTGLLFEPGDRDGLAAALQTLLANREQRLRFGAAAARRMREEFSLTAAARRMGEIYRAALERVC
ncbi:MAG TPA: glycosyltransferase [Bryobacteraceae bacterium]|nr:glycosyltransferase [Bryobacteraceae bacterium]